MNVKKIMSIFQSFYVDVSIEELTLTLPISFVKRFEYTQMTFHKESFLLIKEKRRGSLSSFVTQARTIGENSNIGAASVFVNYDGVNKHRSTVGNNVRMGSDNMYVAPVNIGDGAYSGAGTVIRKDVPAGALAINVAPQRNLEGWVLENQAGTEAAVAASAAGAQAKNSSEESEK